jgi:hypothetical protein
MTSEAFPKQVARSKVPTQMPLSSCQASEAPLGDQVGRKKLPTGPVRSQAAGLTSIAGGGELSRYSLIFTASVAANR